MGRLSGITVRFYLALSGVDFQAEAKQGWGEGGEELENPPRAPTWRNPQKSVFYMKYDAKCRGPQKGQASRAPKF